MTTKRVKLAVLPPVDQVPPFIPAVAAGMKALSNGEAQPHQQKLVFDWLVKEAAGIGAQSFRTGDSHATAFMDGRRFVGISIMALLQQKGTENG